MLHSTTSCCPPYKAVLLKLEATVILFDYNKAIITPWDVTVTLNFHTLATVPSEVQTSKVLLT